MDLEMEVLKAVPYVQVKDLEASIRFHCNILGYTIREQLNFSDGQVFWASLENANSQLMLSSLMVHDYSRLMWLYVEDVDEAYNECVSKGYNPLSEPCDQEHGNREFLARDDSGEVYVIATPIKK